MKRLNFAAWAVALLFFACTSAEKSDEAKSEEAATTAAENTETKPETMAMPDSATMMKNWQEYMTPGDMHKMMAKWDGNWNSDITMWMQPGAPEQKEKGSTVNKMIMNGLYQQSNHSGNMMGMPFNGMSLVGYDIHHKEFISTWIDNMGSGIMVLKGPWDEANKMITLKGKMTDPGSKADMDITETYKVIDDNTHEMEMFVGMPDGKEFKTMNIKFTRKK